MKVKTCLAALFFLVDIAQPVLAQPDDPALVRTFTVHRGVNAVAFSPDGRYALSGGDDKTLKLWDVSTGREIRIFRGHSDFVLFVAFSPDGRYALSGSVDKNIKLWEVSTSKLIRIFEGHSSTIYSVAFSPDGHYALSGSSDNTLKLWEVATGGEIRTFKGHTKGITEGVFSPDGHYALSGSYDNTLKLWEVGTGREVRTFKGHTDGISGVDFSPDGNYALSSSRDKTLKLWEVATGREIRTFIGHSERIYDVAFSSNGDYALSGGKDKTLKLWDVSTGRLIRIFEGHSASITSVAFSPDGRYALTCGKNTLKLWDISPWTKPAEKPLVEAETPLRPQPAKKPAAKVDKIPPVIQIHQPPIARGMKKITQSTKDVLVKGRATDDSGIYEVLVNGQEASSLDAQGNFWAEVKLTVGDNKIVVKATDIHDNTASTDFTVVREAGEAPGPDVVRQDDFIKGQYYALIIGIDSYSGEWPPLRNAVHDAKGVKEILESQYQFDRTITLFDRQATRADIIQQMEWLTKNVREEDNLLIYYSGHGELDERLNRGFWVPVDAKTRSIAHYIPNSLIQTFLGGIRSRHTLLVSDACFSGDIFRGRASSLSPADFSDMDRYYKEVHKRPSRQAITSGGIEPVVDRGRDGHSVFTYYFLKALKENRDRYYDAGQLFERLKIPVANNSDQTPICQAIKDTGDEGGQFIFVRKR